MKFHNLLILPLLAAAMTACSDVAEDDRYIDTGEFIPARAVLIEDFTGQNCVNCPDAHEAIEQLEEQYNKDGEVYIIPVSIHAGAFAIPEYRGGLGTDEGGEYNTHYGINKWPAGVIDGNSGILTYDQWAGVCRADMSMPATMNIDIIAEKAEDGKSANITVSVNPEITAKGDLMVWVVENGIVAKQKHGNEELEDYVHNNVFRTAVNGTWGETVEFVAGDVMEFGYNLTFKDNWNPDNLAIVAFVGANGSVAGVNRAPVK